MEFYDALKGATKETFRLELLDVYDVDEERESFEAFKKGGEITYDNADREWLATLDKLGVRGVRMRRVHVATYPISDYIKYEVAIFAKWNREEIKLMDRADYAMITKPLEPQDFWLVDNTYLFLVDYDRGGKWLGFRQVEDEGLITEYVLMKKLLLEDSRFPH